MFSLCLPMALSSTTMIVNLLPKSNKMESSILFLGLLSIALVKIPIYSMPESSVSEDMMIDPFSWMMVFLTVVLIFLTNSFSSTCSNMSYSQMTLLCHSLAFICVITFVVKDLFFFFVFFELSLIPIFMVILGWGYQPERLSAGKMMLFYTLFGSMPFLLMMVLMKNAGFKTFTFMGASQIFNQSFLVIITLFFLLLLKLPLFGLHLWLPAAHVEAPVQGSILLAGILLKLGGYGLWRISALFALKPLMPVKWLVALTLLGMAASVLTILSQTDIKVIIAYSSVAHMTIAFLGILIQSSYSNSGSLIMFIGHTIISANMFLMAAMFFYSSNTRNIIMNKGFLQIQPFLMLLWALTCVFNAGGPFTLSLMSEIILINSINSIPTLASLSIFIFLMAGMFYNILIYTKISHSNFNKNLMFKENKLMVSSSLFYTIFMILSTLVLFMYFL